MKSPRAWYFAGLAVGILLMFTPLLAFLLNILTVQHAFENEAATASSLANNISRNIKISVQSMGSAVLGLVLVIGSVVLLVRSKRAKP